MIEAETQTIEVEVVTNTEVTSTSQVEVETVDLSDLDITVAKKEYVITGDDIYIPMLYDDAPQWMKDLVQLVVDVSISSGNQSLINDMSAMLQDFAVSYVPLNQYTQSIIDLSDEDTRINALIETLNSNFNDGLSTANAQIISLQLTKASKDEVVAQVIQTIAAQLADGASNIGSTIGRIDQAIANETSARALSLQTLTASLEDTNLDVTANAEVIQNALAYVGIDEAGASTGTGVSAYLEDSSGNIGGADSALANSIRVTAEGVESKFAYNSIVNVNGVYKKSGFGLTTNYTSGTGTQVDPYVSEFWIDASRLKFTNSNKTGAKAPFTIDASGSTPQIQFNGIVSFSNVSNTQGSGTNLLYNSAPKISSETKGWSIGWSNHGLSSSINAGFDPWRPTGGASVYMVVPGNPGIGTVFDINNSRFPVMANTRYEASAYISSHRCNSWVTLAWFDSNGNYISESTGTSNSNASSGPLANWSRSTMFATAPSNAATAQFYVRSSVTSDNPYCFVAYAYAGVASTNQTIASNWSEGSSAGVSSSDVVNEINNGQTTTINGGRITTGSISAAQIAANSISADRISSTNGSSTVWNGGGLVSANFNGNVVGNIGSPTSGFRLSSNAAGTSTDPNIYGAYIKGSYLQGSIIDVEDMKVRAVGYPSNFGRVSYSFKDGIVAMPGYGSGFLQNRLCSKSVGIVKVDCWAKGYDDRVKISLEYSNDGINWGVIRTHTSLIAGMTNSSHVVLVFSEVINNYLANDDGYLQFRLVDAGSEQPSTHEYSSITISIFNS
ncbi:MAG: hypothetical protein ACMV1B_09190 [Prevotella sp.]